MDSLDILETHRIELQSLLDSEKTREERNRLGQFSTPTQLAIDVLAKTRRFLPLSDPIRFLDPAFGTGSFYSALLKTFSDNEILEAVGYEIDDHYGSEARHLWRERPLRLLIEDFTHAKLPNSEQEKFNLVVCNPPYVRHHHLSQVEKKWLQSISKIATGIKVDGLSGLYVYFIYLAHAWLAENGIATWLIPSEFMDVKYGASLRDYLTNHVTLLAVHRFSTSDLQFDDAVVSSSVVWFQKRKPTTHDVIRFSFGAQLLHPDTTDEVSYETLRNQQKWSSIRRLTQRHHGLGETTHRLKDVFSVKRGIATGANNFFIITPAFAAQHKIPDQFLRPILPSPRALKTDIVESDSLGQPIQVPSLLLFDSDIEEAEIKEVFPSVWQYLQYGKAKGVDKGYLCRSRQLWYSQDKREPAPFLCTYMGRSRPAKNRANPFRFIMNHSIAVAPNVYLNLYPKPELAEQIRARPDLKLALWEVLQSIDMSNLIGEGRTYGGGLHKIEPKELGEVSIRLNEATKGIINPVQISDVQLNLF